ncbi:MAG: RHS repeat-associated core domain-containing protein [Puia sp.]|nr:RHS repeat-associated core domain-containing protein [Puia sp.]
MWEIEDEKMGGPPAAASTMPHRSTGKEHDTESGNDYFGARYYASTMGRFMSPDSFANDFVLANPQTWNLYTYGRNNPLVFIDPDGRRVELLGDADQRKKELALLQHSIGNDKEGEARIGTTSEVDKDGNTHYFVGIKGDVGDFMKISDTAHDLANLASDKVPTVEFGLTKRDLSSEGGAATFAIGADGGNKNVRVLINPSELPDTSYFFQYSPLGQMRFGLPSSGIQPLTVGVTAWHEFGHAWGYIHGRVGEPSYSEARAWENRMRQQVYGPLGPHNEPRVRE